MPLDVVRPRTLVGRGAELSLVRGATTPVVLVAGEPGLGKTRLLAEALPTLNVGGVTLRLQSSLGLPGVSLYRAGGGRLGAQSVANVVAALQARSDVVYAEPNRW